MAICPFCGYDKPDGTFFCDKCGKGKVDEAPVVYHVKDPSTGPLYEVHLGQYFKKGWQTFLQYPLGFIGFNLIMMAIIAIFSFLNKRIPEVGSLVCATAITPLYVGDNIVTAKLLQRRPCRFSDFFSGIHYYRPLIIFGLIFGLVGEIDYFMQTNMKFRMSLTLALIVFWVIYLFTPLLIVDRRLGWWQAMELSRKTVQRRFLKIIFYVFSVSIILMGFIFASGGIVSRVLHLFFPTLSNLSLSIIGGVGAALVAIPMASAALTVAYADLFGLQSQEY